MHVRRLAGQDRCAWKVPEIGLSRPGGDLLLPVPGESASQIECCPAEPLLPEYPSSSDLPFIWRVRCCPKAETSSMDESVSCDESLDGSRKGLDGFMPKPL